MSNSQLANGDLSFVTLLGMRFDIASEREVLDLVAARSPQAPFGFVVTPNVQHVIDLSRRPELRHIYNEAMLCVCDSQPVRLLSNFLGDKPPLVTGSDLTLKLFSDVIGPGDTVSVICASDDLADALKMQHPQLDWRIKVPSADAEPGTAMFNECVDFLKSNPARFVFVCLGAPKSELMCLQLASEREMTGTAFCTGAALEFLVGHKRRAPMFFKRYGIEWTYRLVTEPKRLWKRYVFGFVPLLKLFIGDLASKKRSSGRGK